MMYLCFVRFLVCLYVCVFECLLHNNMRMYTSNQYSYVRVWGPLQEYSSIRPGISGLLYYCAPLVCVSEAIKLPAVWRHNKPTTKKTIRRWAGRHNPSQQSGAWKSELDLVCFRPVCQHSVAGSGLSPLLRRRCASSLFFVFEIPFIQKAINGKF